MVHAMLGPSCVNDIVLVDRSYTSQVLSTCQACKINILLKATSDITPQSTKVLIIASALLLLISNLQS